MRSPVMGHGEYSRAVDLRYIILLQWKRTVFRCSNTVLSMQVTHSLQAQIIEIVFSLALHRELCLVLFVIPSYK
jgi:hypothetical protein